MPIQRSKINGAVLARSSQPNVGFFGWRLNEDEQLLKEIADCCAASGKTPESIISTSPNTDLLKLGSSLYIIAKLSIQQRNVIDRFNCKDLNLYQTDKSTLTSKFDKGLV